jgi:hypothetical protein
MISRSNSSALSVVVIAIVLVILNIAAPTLRAQESATRPAAADTQKEKEAEQRQELEKKTRALLNDVASAVWGLKLPENRFFVLANAGDLFWAIDEKRARALYWDALNSLNALNATVRTSEKISKAEQERVAQAYISVFNLRQKLLRQIAHRDSQLALDMLRATRQAPPPQSESKYYYPDDRQLEQEIASQIAARDPARALQLARQSLAKGLTLEVLNLLDRLNQKDSEKASEFAGEIIDKLQTTNLATDFRVSLIAFQLLQNSRVRESHLSANVTSSEGFKVLSLDDDQKREVVELLTNAALSASANSNLLYHITGVMPEIEQFFPERRTAIERKLAAFNETLTRQLRDQNAYSTLIRNGQMEEIIRIAANADVETRPPLYQQAAIIAISQGKADSFRDFVSKEVSDSGERNKIFDLLDAEEITVAAGRKQLDELRKLLPKIRRKEERARAMAELALMLKEKGEDEEAATSLSDAETLIKTDLKDEKQTNALLTLLCAYAVIDPAKAFAIAERTVDQANSEISLLMLLDRVVKSRAVRKNEIILDQAGIMPIDFLVFKYGKGVAALAKADFNRTKALADRFERNELRVMAQLFIIKGLLQPAPSSVEVSTTSR